MNCDIMTVKYTAYCIVFIIQVMMSVTSYIPQIVKLIKNKNSTNISYTSCVIGLFDYSSYQALLILDNASVALQILNLIQIVQIIAIMILIKRYEVKEWV